MSNPSSSAENSTTEQAPSRRRRLNGSAPKEAPAQLTPMPPETEEAPSATAPKDPEPPKQNGTAAPNGTAGPSEPVPPPAGSAPPGAATKNGLFNRLFRRNNRVHDSTYAEQNEFMNKFGNNASGTAPPPEHGQEKSIIKTMREGVLDKSQSPYYYWIGCVSCAMMYNILFPFMRFVFMELEDSFWKWVWVGTDLWCDLIYIVDILARMRTGHLEQGLLVRDLVKIKEKYISSTQFRLDILSLLPLDYIMIPLYTSPCVFRLNRLLRYDRISDFQARTETRSSSPNAFRVLCVVLYIVVIIHWNACIYFLISELIGLNSDTWVYGTLNKQSMPENMTDTLARRYIYSFYWSTLTLTTIGEVPAPVYNMEFIFVTADLMCGVLIFATIVGNVGSMISNMSAARTEFQNRMDGIKQYMELRKVSKQLELRVIKWFDYLWANKQSLSDQQVLKVLPDKLQAEIAMQVHFETLRKVRIFQDCEAGLLAELVLKLQLQIFSPGDFICRKGDIGREMYIVKKGKLQVVGEDGHQVFATLQEGAVFGELSILNIAGSKNGNRRTANVKSVGYTDLFVLNKNDLWNALREYPEARKMLMAKGREILLKDNLLDENAPEETQTPEELAELLSNTVKQLQARLARLISESASTELKLNERIAALEAKLLKYREMGEAHRTSQDGKEKKKRRDKKKEQ